MRLSVMRRIRFGSEGLNMGLRYLGTLKIKHSSSMCYLSARMIDLTPPAGSGAVDSGKLI